jgi:hypothetical protein
MAVKPEAVINLRVPTDLLAKIDQAVETRPLKISRHAWIMEAIYRQLRQETTEGTLDIFWENSEDRSANPKYRLIFCRYLGFQRGAMQPHRIVGEAALRKHLLGLNFGEVETKALIARVKTERSVPIPNVMMPFEQLPQYGYGTSG